MTQFAAVFDMDGLLVDTEPIWHESEHEVFQQLNLPITPEMCQQTAGLRIDQVAAHWYEKYPWERRTIHQVADDIVDKVIEKVQDRGTLMPGVAHAVNAVKQLGWKIGLASSSPMRLINVIVNHFGMTTFFEVLHSGEVETLGKPHPATYLSAAKRLGVPPTKCLALEDSFYGLIAATAARMKTVVVPTAKHYDAPKWAIATTKLPSLEHCNTDLLRRIMS